MRTAITEQNAERKPEAEGLVEASLINLAEHRRSKRDRFPNVDELLERLTDDTVNVANGDYRSR